MVRLLKELMCSSSAGVLSSSQPSKLCMENTYRARVNMADSKLADFGAPKVASYADQGMLKKLAARVEAVLATAINREPLCIDIDAILVSPRNRLGAPPNVCHIHHGIIKGIKNNGWSPTRPLVGIAVEFKTEKGKRLLLEHNERFSRGNHLLPPILVKGHVVWYGSLAASHLNLALRCIRAGVNSPAGDLKSLLDEDVHLREVVQNGHRWWILPEETLVEEQQDISTWRNQDQNENQQTHEIEILQAIKAVAVKMSTSSSKVSLADLIAKAQRRVPSKACAQTFRSLAKLYVGFIEDGAGDMVEDLVDFHASNVDPREVCLSNVYLCSIVNEDAFKKLPHLRLQLLRTQYSTEKVRGAGGGVPHGCFIDIGQILAIAKKPAELLEMEKILKVVHDKNIGLLQRFLAPRAAKLELAVFSDLLLRCFLHKTWPHDFPIKVKLPMGKICPDKVVDLGVLWAKTVDLKHPDTNFAKMAGLEELRGPCPEGDAEIDLALVRGPKRSSSDPPLPEPPSKRFKTGDLVTVVQRMTWKVPSKKHPEFRRDIRVGEEGKILGVADEEGRQVILQVVVAMPEGPRQITQAVNPKSIMLTSEYKLTEAGKELSAAADSAAASSSTSCADEKGSSVPQWLRGDSGSNAVIKQAKWSKSLVCDKDDLMRLSYIKSRVAAGLEALHEVLPQFTEKDFVVAQRQNKQGAWKSELWTNRDFKAYEIILAPYSSQLKDTHLTHSAHAVVGLPKHGVGAHPHGGSLALDGRTRMFMAQANTMDEEEHTGSLYWVVARSSDDSLCNLSTDTFAWEQKVILQLPGQKKKVLAMQRSLGSLPSIPVIVNKKPIDKYTELVLYQKEREKVKGVSSASK